MTEGLTAIGFMLGIIVHHFYTEAKNETRRRIRKATRKRVYSKR